MFVCAADPEAMLACRPHRRQLVDAGRCLFFRGILHAPDGSPPLCPTTSTHHFLLRPLLSLASRTRCKNEPQPTSRRSSRSAQCLHVGYFSFPTFFILSRDFPVKSRSFPHDHNVFLKSLRDFLSFLVKCSLWLLFLGNFQLMFIMSLKKYYELQNSVIPRGCQLARESDSSTTPSLNLIGADVR